MKAKIIFFIVWFITIGGINTMTFLLICKRGSGLPLVYGLGSVIVLMVPSLLFGVMEWSKNRLDIYQKTMTVLLAIAIVGLGLTLLITGI